MKQLIKRIFAGAPLLMSVPAAPVPTHQAWLSSCCHLSVRQGRSPGSVCVRSGAIQVKAANVRHSHRLWQHVRCGSPYPSGRGLLVGAFHRKRLSHGSATCPGIDRRSRSCKSRLVVVRQGHGTLSHTRDNTLVTLQTHAPSLLNHRGLEG